MSKLIVLSIGSGNFEQGFAVILHIGEEGQPPFSQWRGSLPPAPDLPLLYQRWQSAYRDLGKIFVGQRISVPAGPMPHDASVHDCEQRADELQIRLQDWLAQPAAQALQLEILDKVALDEPARLILQTRNGLLRRLPWHLWQLFDRRPQAELALHSAAGVATPLRPKGLSLQSPVKVLAILGRGDGPDQQADWTALKQLPQAQVTLLDQPGLQRVSEQLWRQPWDIVFFAGVGRGDAGGGTLAGNASDLIGLDQLRYALTTAVQHGLKLAIVNAEDGLDLAAVLETAQVPQAIVMREPLPDRVAQTFLGYFLERFATGLPLHLALRQAREQLQWLEAELPCATWLPVMCQNPATIAPLWPRSSDALELSASRAMPIRVPSQPVASNPRTTHCLNPDCLCPGPHRWTDLACPTCGTSLRLHDRYIPLQCLEAGRFLETFRVYDLKTKREQLLQVMMTADPAAIAQFRQETVGLRQIRDRGLPRIYDPDFEVQVHQPAARTLLCRVFEPLLGTPLQRVLQLYPEGCSAVWVLDWLKQAIALLQILHSHQIIHRNLTPETLILRRDTGALAIVGFGGKLRPQRQQPRHLAVSPTALVYYSPEQLRQTAVPASADFYALGMIAIHLLTGKHPFEFRDPETGRFHWQSANLRLPTPLIELLDQMVHPDTRLRPHTAAGIQARLVSMHIKAAPQALARGLATPRLAVPPAGRAGLHPALEGRQAISCPPPVRSALPARPPISSRGGRLPAGAAVLHMGDAAISALNQAGQAFGIGAISSAIAGFAGLWLIDGSPIDMPLRAALRAWHLPPTLLVFALAATSTVWLVTQSRQEMEAQPRLWLTLGEALLGYGLVWQVLPYRTQPLACLALLFALLAALSLGSYRLLWLKSILTVGGTLLALSVWQQSGLWHPSFQVLLSGAAGKVIPLMDVTALGMSLLLLAGLGGVVSFWLSLSDAIAEVWWQRLDHTA
jgi:hypothetical protein